MKDLSIPLRLCVFARVNKKYWARKAAKPQRVRRGGGQELQQLDTRNPPRRAGLPAVGRQEPCLPAGRQAARDIVKDLSIPLRLCAFARVNKKYLSPRNSAGQAPSPPRRTGQVAKPPSRKGLRRVFREEKIRRGGSGFLFSISEL